ncbi:MAG: ZIP family metal transporter [Rhodothermia bacterium]
MNFTISYMPILASVVLIWFASLVGLFGMFIRVERLNWLISHLLSFAVGALLGGAFLHLIPQALSDDVLGPDAPLYIVAGIMLFFVLERFLHWHHEHHVELGQEMVHPVVAMNIVGGTMHNLLDGMLVAAAYGVSVESGIVTTTAVLLHQIPQEMGEFGVLVHGGLSPRKALLYNFLSGSSAVVGAAISIAIGKVASEYSPILLALTAGAFIYIAASDLIPELHRSPGRKSALIQLILMAAGVGVMLIPTLFDGPH